MKSETDAPSCKTENSLEAVKQVLTGGEKQKTPGMDITLNTLIRGHSSTLKSETDAPSCKTEDSLEEVKQVLVNMSIDGMRNRKHQEWIST